MTLRLILKSEVHRNLPYVHLVPENGIQIVNLIISIEFTDY